MRDVLVHSEAQFNRAIGFVLRRARKLTKMNQEEAAEMAGVNRSHLARLERGHHAPSCFTLAKLAECYGVGFGGLGQMIEDKVKSYRPMRRRR